MFWVAFNLRLIMNIPNPNILFIPNVIDDAHALFNTIDKNTHWDMRLSVRKTASFGVAYEYSNLFYPETIMPTWLLPVLEKIQQHCQFVPNNCLINYYQDGQDCMGFHSDDTRQMYKNTGVAIISLGAEREIVYQYKENREIEVRYLLTQGSLLYMDDLVQEKWLHAILKDESITPRISLTFRKLK